MLHSQKAGITTVGDTELGENAGDVVHHRARADRKRVGDLAIGQPLGEEAQDVALDAVVVRDHVKAMLPYA